MCCSKGGVIQTPEGPTKPCSGTAGIPAGMAPGWLQRCPLGSSSALSGPFLCGLVPCPRSAAELCEPGSGSCRNSAMLEVLLCSWVEEGGNMLPSKIIYQRCFCWLPSHGAVSQGPGCSLHLSLSEEVTRLCLLWHQQPQQCHCLGELKCHGPSPRERDWGPGNAPTWS